MPGAFKPDVTLPGLWTDQPDWLNRLRALAATGHINQADADQLAHFADHGWLLMEGAIEPEFVDTFVNDIRNLHRQPGYFATTDFRHGRSHKLNGNQPDELESIFDLYVNLQSSRHVCMHPRIIRFLSLVFQAKVLAFQQLLFQVTNGHRWHQDTALCGGGHADLAGRHLDRAAGHRGRQRRTGLLRPQPPPAALHLQQQASIATATRPTIRATSRPPAKRGNSPTAACLPKKATCSSGRPTWHTGAIRWCCRRTRHGCPA